MTNFKKLSIENFFDNTSKRITLTSDEEHIICEYGSKGKILTTLKGVSYDEQLLIYELHVTDETSLEVVKEALAFFAFGAKRTFPKTKYMDIDIEYIGNDLSETDFHNLGFAFSNDSGLWRKAIL